MSTYSFDALKPFLVLIPTESTKEFVIKSDIFLVNQGTTKSTGFAAIKMTALGRPQLLV